MELKKLPILKEQQLSEINRKNFSSMKYIGEKIKKFPLSSYKPIFLCVVAILIGLGVNPIKNYTRNLKCFQINFSDLRLVNLPDWLLPFTKSIEPEKSKLDKNLNIFNENILLKIKDAYLHNPWIKKVSTIYKMYPNKIYLKAELRKPFVAVKYSYNYILCDANGIRLPGEYVNPLNLVCIEGFVEDMPSAGNKWQDSYLIECIKIAKYIEKSGIKKQIPHYSILVDSIKKKERNIFILINKNKICWGRRFIEDMPYVSPSEKNLALINIVNKGYINNEFTDIKELDIRLGFAIVKKPKWRRKRRKR